MATDEQLSVQRLRELKHIVVVMMENRSFDHMLGYLSLEGMTDVDGLTGAEFNVDPNGAKIAVHPFDAEKAKVQRVGEALNKSLDPDHSPAGVQTQIGDGYGDAPNGGFVKSFIDSRNPDDHVGEDLWMVPMGYYTSKDVPVYDHLARQYCVCDGWFSSIPGDTWPNRVFAMTGEHAENAIGESSLFKHLEHLPYVDKLRSMPLYNGHAFTRHLRDEQWRWYSHDPGTLRLADSTYRDVGNPMRDNFAFYDRRKVDWVTEILEKPIVRGGSFLDDAAKGTLPRVSWIDPNFVDVSVLETASNDDHPPSDIRAGQAFVNEIYDALRRSPAWADTMLVITYDEHGGFHDHVTPPKLPAPDGSEFETYGIRVPALIVGPRVRRGVLHGPRTADGKPDPTKPQFDHASLIKTILLAVADDPDASLPQMSQRVQAAPHLGGLLLDEPRTDVDDPRNVANLVETWRAEARTRREARAGTEEGVHVSAAADGAGHPLVLTDLQVEFAKFSRGLKDLNLNP
jgi:phospholipase C